MIKGKDFLKYQEKTINDLSQITTKKRMYKFLRLNFLEKKTKNKKDNIKNKKQKIVLAKNQLLKRFFSYFIK